MTLRAMAGVFIFILGSIGAYFDWALLARIDLADPDSIMVGLEILLSMVLGAVFMMAVAAGLILLFTSRRKT